MKAIRRPTRLLLLASLVLTPLSRAQTPPASPPKAAVSDEVVTLAEFNVTAGADNSYTAGDTVSGSRMNAKVKDLDYSVSSITSEFIKDNSLFDLTEDLSYISSISGNDDSGAFTVRGFTGANTYLRNGHQRLGLVDVGSVDKVELIKGPSGSIYGQTNPGGALLISTRGPRSTPHESLSASYGAYDLNSDQLHLTGPIPIGKTPKLFYNFDGTYLRRGYDDPAQIRTQKAVAGTLLFKPSNDTDFTFDTNYQSFKNPNEFGLPNVIHTGPNPYTGANMTYFDGFAWQLRKGHYASPTDWKWRRATGYTATLEHRFTQWLAGHASYDYYHNPIETYDTLRETAQLNPAIGTLARSSTAPNWATIYGSGHSVTGDLLAHYSIGKTQHQTLLTIDDYLNNRRDYAKTLIGPSPLPATSVPINPFAPIDSPFIPMDNSHFTSSTTRNNAVDSAGFGLTHRATLFSDRLFVDLGYRHDYVRGLQQNPAAAVTAVAYTGATPGSGRESRIHDSNDAAKFGLNYKINSDVSWYASAFQSFIPFGTSVPLTVSLPTGTTAATADPRVLKTLSPASETSLGYETGLKGSSFDELLRWSAAVYDTHRKNVGVTELSNINDPSSPTVTVNEGDQTSKGFEFDGEYTFHRKLHAYISYSYVDSRVSNQGVNVYANGKRPRAVAYNSVGSSLNYNVTTGLTLLVSMRYQGNTPSQSPSTGLIKNPKTGLNDASNGQADIRNPAFAVWNVGARYSWKSRWENLSQSINVAAKNVFDKRYISPGSNTFVGDGFGTYVTYSIAH